MLHPSPRYCSPSKGVALCILAPHNRGPIIILRVGQKEGNREREREGEIFEKLSCPWWTVSLHSEREIILFFFPFFFLNVLFSLLSLWRELCCLLLMCFWQLNLISGLLVKGALDCSHRKNRLLLFFSSLPCSSKCCRTVCRWPSSERWSKTRKSSAKSTGRRKEKRQEG